MKDKDKKIAGQADGNDEKLNINKSVFQINKELKQQREEEQLRQEEEIARRRAEKEKQQQEDYEKKLRDEKIELMRLKQGIAAETAEEPAEKEEEIKLTFKQKLVNFFYHNKWWLGLGTFMAVLAIFLTYDFITKPRPDMTVLMLCKNDTIGTAPALEKYFSKQGDFLNKDGKIKVAVNYIPYSDDDYQNYTNGVTVKLTSYLNNNEAVMIIGNKKTVTDLLVPEDTLVDLSKIYPGNPHVDTYFFYVKGTDFAKEIGVPESAVTDDMFFALRKPQDIINASKEDMQKTYDKDFPVFDMIVRKLSYGKTKQ